MRSCVIAVLLRDQCFGRLAKQGRGGAFSPAVVADVVQCSPPVLPGFTAKTPPHFETCTYYLFTGDAKDGAFLVYEGHGLESLRARFPAYGSWPSRPQPREQVLWHLEPKWKRLGYSQKVVPHLIADPGICKASNIDVWSGCVSGYVVENDMLVVKPVAFKYGQDSDRTLLLPLQLRSTQCSFTQYIEGFKISLGLQHGRGKHKTKRLRSYVNVSPQVLLSEVHSGAVSVTGVRGDNLLVSTSWADLCADPEINEGRWFDNTAYTLVSGHEIAVNLKKRRLRVQTDHEVLRIQKSNNGSNEVIPEQPLMDV